MRLAVLLAATTARALQPCSTPVLVDGAERFVECGGPHAVEEAVFAFLGGLNDTAAVGCATEACVEAAQKKEGAALHRQMILEADYCVPEDEEELGSSVEHLHPCPTCREPTSDDFERCPECRASRYSRCVPLLSSLPMTPFALWCLLTWWMMSRQDSMAKA